jgi:hypothetical protein
VGVEGECRVYWCQSCGVEEEEELLEEEEEEEEEEIEGAGDGGPEEAANIDESKGDSILEPTEAEPTE